jgi:hypothetical protein
MISQPGFDVAWPVEADNADLFGVLAIDHPNIQARMGSLGASSLDWLVDKGDSFG